MLSEIRPWLDGLGIGEFAGTGLVARTPIDGSALMSLRADAPGDVDGRVAMAADAFRQWRAVPAPRRGELVRLLGEELRAHKAAAWPAGVDRGRQDSRAKAQAKCRR